MIQTGTTVALLNFINYFCLRFIFLNNNSFVLLADENVVSSDDELSGLEVDVQEGQTRSEDRELKDRLLRKFGSHISSLKLEFSKKKKKGKLPKEARQTLMEWWNVHYKWPYPTVSKLPHSSITKCYIMLIQDRKSIRYNLDHVIRAGN